MDNCIDVGKFRGTTPCLCGLSASVSARLSLFITLKNHKGIKLITWPIHTG